MGQVGVGRSRPPLHTGTFPQEPAVPPAGSCSKSVRLWTVGWFWRYWMPGDPASLFVLVVSPGPDPSAAWTALCWWCKARVTSRSWRLLLKAPEYFSEPSYESLM